MTAPGAGAMRDEDWRSLTSAIENGTCILMLGPDAFVAGRRRARIDSLAG